MCWSEGGHLQTWLRLHLIILLVVMLCSVLCHRPRAPLAVGGCEAQPALGGSQRSRVLRHHCLAMSFLDLCEAMMS